MTPLIIGNPVVVSFKLDITGATETPKVRVILACSPELIFYASKVGDYWQAEVTAPVSATPGSCQLRIEVILNNRLFVPISKQVDIVSPYVSMHVAPVEPAPVEPTPAASVELTADTKEIQPAEIDFAVRAEEKQPEKKKITLPPDLFKSILNAESSPSPKLPVKPLIPRGEPVEESSCEVKPKKQPKKRTPVVEIKQEIPVVLMKGEIIIE